MIFTKWSPALFSISLHFPTMHPFALRQHFLSSVAFQSIHEILLWHFQGLLSLQGRFLPFLVSIISLFKSWCFFTFSLSFSPTFTSAGTGISMIIPFFCKLKLCLVFLALSRCYNERWYPATFSSTALPGTCLYHFSVCYEPFFLQRSQWDFFATLSCRLLYSFWANFLHPLTNCCKLSVFFQIICPGGVFIDVFDLVLYINWTNGFFMCSK